MRTSTKGQTTNGTQGEQRSKSSGEAKSTRPSYRAELTCPNRWSNHSTHPENNQQQPVRTALDYLAEDLEDYTLPSPCRNLKLNTLS
ncbi:hypothetical protein V6N13_009106 [Hibiscus sabdariffa]